MTFVNTCARQIRDARDRLQRLSPNHRDPEAFHIEKSEIMNALRNVADLLEGKWELADGEDAERRRRRRRPVTTNGNVLQAAGRFRSKP